MDWFPGRQASREGDSRRMLFYLLNMNDQYAGYLNVAIESAREAGLLALSMQGQLKEVRFKGEKDIVTEADLACDAAIRLKLERAFPDHNIVTEEAAAVSHGSGFTWFVDPIDSTVNYSRGFPLWGVSVGLREGSSMIAGAIYLPAIDEMFHVTLGGGAFLNGKTIRASGVDKLADAIISHGDFNVGVTDKQRWRLNKKTLMARLRSAAALQRVKCLGSAVLEGAFVASGRMEAYCMMAMKPWDVAVGSLLVTEAGVKVTGVDGSPFSVEGHDALFSNGILHADLLRVLSLEPAALKKNAG